MNLGNQVEWALHCMSILASVPEGISVPAKVLAELHGVPKEYLAKSMQLLSNEGLVATSLGPKGGYRLAKPANEITFLDIVEAVEGRKKTFNCQEIRGNSPCAPKTKPKNVCQIASVMYQADESWRSVLRKKKLSDLVSQLQREIDPELLRKTGDWLQSQLKI